MREKRERRGELDVVDAEFDVDVAVAAVDPVPVGRESKFGGGVD